MEMQKLLSPIGAIYGSIIRARNKLYDRGWLASHHLGARTISIGNLTTGGTGKTPLVALAARILAEAGEKVCILTRGYGRKQPRRRVLVSDGKSLLADAMMGGDEAFELSEKLIGKAIVISDANRVAAAKWSRSEFSPTVYLLDDGFQHRRARRDLDIVLIDATNPFGGGPFGRGRMLPAGLLREQIENLGRADAVVITRANLSVHAGKIKEKIRKLNPSAPIFTSENKMLKLTPLAEECETNTTQICESIAAKRLFAFCALGNPENFFRQLELEGLSVAGNLAFPDHHFYTLSDRETIEAAADASSADALITTGKDAAKLRHMAFNRPCLVVSIIPVIDHLPDFRKLLLGR